MSSFPALPPWRRLRAALAFTLLAAPTVAVGQARYDSTLWAALKWREIGPFRGGRSVAVAGVGGAPIRVLDGHHRRRRLQDDRRRASPGRRSPTSTSAAPSARSRVSRVEPRHRLRRHRRVRRSAATSRTATASGRPPTPARRGRYARPQGDAADLARARRTRRDPDIVYVARAGPRLGAERRARRLSRSTDGGKTLATKILFRNDSTGVRDSCMDPSNPNVLYAALWQAGRNAVACSSPAATGSGIFKSDRRRRALDRDHAQPPACPRGRHRQHRHRGVAREPEARLGDHRGRLAAASSSLATMAARRGRRTNDDRKLRQRAWYYSRIFADPKDANTVYVLNTGIYRVDRRREDVQARSRVPHGDNHDLWIAPERPDSG